MTFVIKKLPMRFAHIFLFRNPERAQKNMIAAGSGYNGCATATDFHRNSLLQTINMQSNISKFPVNANEKTGKNKVFLKKMISGNPQPLSIEKYPFPK